MFSRVNTLRTTGKRIDDVARVVHDVVLPGISEEPGFRGYIVLGDRENGKALGVTLWESAEAMQASDAKARTIRPRVEEATGGVMESVEHFEVLLFRVEPP
jgi:quinol monooxygenase YgiN